MWSLILTDFKAMDFKARGFQGERISGREDFRARGFQSRAEDFKAEQRISKQSRGFQSRAEDFKAEQRISKQRIYKAARSNGGGWGGG